jgi:hypothetical protein
VVGTPTLPGAPLGILIGLVTGVVFAVLLSTAITVRSLSNALKLAPELLALPTFHLARTSREALVLQP